MTAMCKIFDSVELETVEKLAKIVKDNELSEISISNDDFNITIKGKKCPPPAPVMPMGMPMAAPTAAPVQTADAPKAEIAEGNSFSQGSLRGRLSWERSPFLSWNCSRIS